MKINIRRNSTYLDANITNGDTKISLGLLDSNEAIDLAKEFIEAAEKLLPSYGCDLAEAVLQSVRENL